MEIIFFACIAAMRVVQQICTKKVSNKVKGDTFFHYGGYYNLVSALFSLFVLIFIGFYGFDWKTTFCALGTAIFMAVELFASIEALKGCSLIVGQMFSVGALCIPCIIGTFLFDERMSLLQWIGFVLFMIAMYFMVSPSRTRDKNQCKQKVSKRTVLMLIITTLAGGGTMVVQKVFGRLVPNGNTAVYSFLMFALNAILLYCCYIVMSCCRKRKKVVQIGGELDAAEKRYKPLPKILLICGMFLAFAVFAINMLVTELGKTVSSAILFSVSYAISISITLLVGHFYYKEKMNKRNIVGILLCIVALAMINFL